MPFQKTRQGRISLAGEIFPLGQIIAITPNPSHPEITNHALDAEKTNRYCTHIGNSITI